MSDQHIETWRQLKKSLAERFFERQTVAEGLILAALSGQHVILLGPPGTAKTQLTKAFSQALGLRHFPWLLSRFSTPEELFGPVDLEAFKKGSYRRITRGKMPEAETVFLDEIFKANSAILNSLLALLEERVFYNDAEPTKTPLRFCTAASNELPEEDEALDALYDRFMLRYHVSALSKAGFVKMIGSSARKSRDIPTIDQTTLMASVEAVSCHPIDPEVPEAMANLRHALSQEGITPSDRRFVNALRIIQAYAWLHGDPKVTAKHLVVGGHIFWDRPDQARKVATICEQVPNLEFLQAEDSLKAAEELRSRVLASGDKGEAVAAVAQLKRVSQDLWEQGKKDPRFNAIAVRIKEVAMEISRTVLGIEED